MPLWLISTAYSIQLLALALMAGGMLALGAVSAPVLFKSFDRIAAGEAMTLIFRRYDAVLLVSGVALAISEALLWLSPLGRVLTRPVLAIGWFHLALVLAILLLGSISLFWLNPQMEAAQSQGIALLEVTDPRVQTFAKWHRWSETLYKVQLVLALAVLAGYPYFMALSQHLSTQGVSQS